MKKKIKLKDLTEEQFRKYKKDSCDAACSECIFRSVICTSTNYNCWVYHKDLYSNKFLNQEIEIEVPTFTYTEQQFLHNLLEPFKGRIVEMKLLSFLDNEFVFLEIVVKSIVTTNKTESISLPYFKIGTMYKNLEFGKSYKNQELKTLLEELNLE